MKKLLFILLIALCSCTRTSTTVVTETVPDSLSTDSIVITKTITTTEVDAIDDVTKGVTAAANGIEAVSVLIAVLNIFYSCSK